jgi:predicted Zn-dependent protease
MRTPRLCPPPAPCSSRHGAAGRKEEAAAAARQVTVLARLPAPVLAASGMLAAGHLYGAERILRPYLAAHPRDIEAMRLLGQLGLQLDVLDDAEFLLESVLAFAPDYHIARYDYAQVLTEKRTRAVRRAHYWPPNL